MIDEDTAGRDAASGPPVLGLPRGLELRPWTDADAGALLAAGQDADVRRWNLFGVASEDEARGRIARMRERWEAGTGVVWAIAERGGNGSGAVGLIGCNDLDPTHRSAELVYWLLPAARGRGLAVDAVRRVTRWAVEEFGLHRLRLCHSTANPASCRVAEKAGYSFEGTMRGALLHEDGWHDQHLHAFLRGDRLPALAADRGA
ncbi:GNAT family N-acetyltransferase [Kitasatospora sp. NPDC051853]|uniref:GNAT family N-acetyltransferase n=1 Tax=Kitasatospora sp. NPDC051853 TaxID=3364058 RepID=UPI0037AE25E3